MPDLRFRFGRLISTEAMIGGFPAHLVYLYKADSASRLPVPTLSPNSLLLPPLGVNQKPWTLGFFEVVESRSLHPDDVLAQHCFRDFRGRCVDERGRLLDQPTGPCGQYALHSHRSLDDLLSEALGFPPA
jgi:hypothetical protein